MTQHRTQEGFNPSLAESDAVGGLSLCHRSVYHKPAVRNSDGKQTVLFVEVSFLDVYICYGRYAASVFCRESALEEVHSAQHIGIEYGKHSQKMPGLIDRSILKKVEVVVSGTAPDIQIGFHFSARGHPGQHLQGFQYIRGIQYGLERKIVLNQFEVSGLGRFSGFADVFHYQR